MQNIRKIVISPHFQFFMYEPEGILSDHIALIWTSWGTPPFKEERIFPDGANVLLFNFDNPICIRNGSSEIVLKRSLFTGVTSQFINLNYSTPEVNHKQAGVVFKPGGAFPFIRQSLIAFKNQATDTADLNDRYFEDMYEIIGSIDDPQMRICRLVQMLKARLQEFNPDQLAPQIISLIQRYPEKSIEEIVQKTGYSHQHLNRLLGKYAGINAKGFQKIFRLHKAMKAVYEMGPHINLTNISYHAGYYDQAHFIHEFKEMTGMTPRDFQVIKPPEPNRVLYLT